MKNMEARSLIVFENSIKSEYTKRAYIYGLRKFVQFHRLENITSILTVPDKELQVMLEDWLFYLKKKLKANTIKPFFSGLELFCTVNDKNDINWKKIRKMFPAGEKLTGRRAWTNDEIKRMLETTKELRTKSLIHFLASTGCRIGAVPNLRISNLVDMSQGCAAVLFYEGTTDEYWGFLTPEATRYLRSYLAQRKQDGEILDGKQPLFREKYRIGIAKPEFCSKISLEMLVYRAIKLCGIHGERKGQRYESMTNHAFRKRFNNILKNSNEGNIALKEKLMGHKGVFSLDGSYHNPDIQTLFDEFSNHVENLTVDDSERDKIKIRNLESEKSELEKRSTEVQELRQRIEELEYGAQARKATYANNMLRFRQQKDRVGEVFSMLWHYLLERGRTEEEKREFLKRIKKAKENGEEMDSAWLLEALGVSAEDLENAENLLRDNPRARNILSEFIQTVIQKGRNFDNYSLPALLTG